MAVLKKKWQCRVRGMRSCVDVCVCGLPYTRLGEGPMRRHFSKDEGQRNKPGGPREFQAEGRWRGGTFDMILYVENRKQYTIRIKAERKIWFKTIAIGERMWTQLHRKERWESFKPWGGQAGWLVWLGHLPLLTGAHRNQAPAFPQTLDNRGADFLDDAISEGWPPGPGARLGW